MAIAYHCMRPLCWFPVLLSEFLDTCALTSSTELGLCSRVPCLFCGSYLLGLLSHNIMAYTYRRLISVLSRNSAEMLRLVFVLGSSIADELGTSTTCFPPCDCCSLGRTVVRSLPAVAKSGHARYVSCGLRRWMQPAFITVSCIIHRPEIVAYVVAGFSPTCFLRHHQPSHLYVLGSMRCLFCSDNRMLETRVVHFLPALASSDYASTGRNCGLLLPTCFLLCHQSRPTPSVLIGIPWLYWFRIAARWKLLSCVPAGGGQR
ncbi:hypothetical protein OE88DRAFT_774460 [Heliocybe sulcata]|uniref:Uncharacterized protein n=1 Tax=Heliocybe sulcata TaxID=5364 RepID=A0A5C3N1I3_9AGAM|nr:hypothetical protein OE88DRAFT_774460 [Heliocybe sulcata]